MESAEECIDGKIGFFGCKNREKAVN